MAGSIKTVDPGSHRVKKMGSLRRDLSGAGDWIEAADNIHPDISGELGIAPSFDTPDLCQICANSGRKWVVADVGLCTPLQRNSSSRSR